MTCMWAFLRQLTIRRLASPNQARVKRAQARLKLHKGTIGEVLLVTSHLFYVILFIRSKSKGPDYPRCYTKAGIQRWRSLGAISEVALYTTTLNHTITLHITVGGKSTHFHLSQGILEGDQKCLFKRGYLCKWD